MTSPKNDAISAQYNAFQYPDPSFLVEQRRPWNDPSLFSAIYWPMGAPKTLRCLVAGCGTSEAVALALRNPTAQITAIDVSEASLEATRKLAESRGCADQIKLHHLAIEEIESLGESYDFISAGGVLHHLASPEAGLKALGSCLSEDGVIAAAVYAHFARPGLQMVCEVFKQLNLKPDARGIHQVRETLQVLSPTHPIQSWMMQTGEHGEVDSHLVDTWLNARERDYTVPQILELCQAANLRFQGFLENTPYHADSLFAPETAMYQSLSRLEGEAHWSAMERLAPTPDHCFIACRTDRDQLTYELDFLAPRFLQTIPGRRFPTTERCPKLPYDPRNAVHDAIYRSIDGVHTVAELLEHLPLQGPKAQIEALVRAFLRHLWRKDAVFFRW